MDTSNIDLIPQLHRWSSRKANLNDEERGRVLQIVGGTWTTLRDAGAQFGFRTAKAIVRFVSEVGQAQVAR